MKLAPTDERSATERAYDEGVEDAGIKADIKEIQRHQAQINGSVGRTADGLEKVTDCLDEILGRLDKRDTVDAERATVATEARDAAVEARKDQVNRRTFITTAVGIVISLAALFASAVYYLGSTT